jgi:hypothetical protein
MMMMMTKRMMNRNSLSCILAFRTMFVRFSFRIRHSWESLILGSCTHDNRYLGLYLVTPKERLQICYDMGGDATGEQSLGTAVNQSRWGIKIAIFWYSVERNELVAFH